MRRLVVVPLVLLCSLVSGIDWGGVQYTVTDLDTLGGSNSYATAVNSSGQVVGYAQTGSGDDHAFLYSNGMMTDLGTLG